MKTNPDITMKRATRPTRIRRSMRIHDAPARGLEYGFRTGIHFQFAVDVFDMSADRQLRDEQEVPDLQVTESAREQMEDFVFARRESLLQRRLGCLSGGLQLQQQMPRNDRADGRSSTSDVTYIFRTAGELLVLEQITARARLDAVEHLRLVGEDRDDQDISARVPVR